MDNEHGEKKKEFTGPNSPNWMHDSLYFELLF